jgi:hypothetical protein
MYLSEKNIVRLNADLLSTIKTAKNEFKSITFNIIKSLNAHLAYDITYPILHVGMKYEISWLTVLIFTLIILNYLFLKNDIFGLFLLIDMLLILS